MEELGSFGMDFPLIYWSSFLEVYDSKVQIHHDPMKQSNAFSMPKTAWHPGHVSKNSRQNWQYLCFTLSIDPQQNCECQNLAQGCNWFVI